MRQTNFKKQYTKLMKRDSLERMHVAVGTILMYMFTQELGHIFVERNQHSLKALKASPVAPG